MAKIYRFIYEYERWNPQLGTSIRTDEVYETTLTKAERTAKRKCDSYTTYGSLYFKRIIKQSEPIVLGVDVEETKKTYGEYPREKTYKEYRNMYPNTHTDGWDKLKEI